MPKVTSNEGKPYEKIGTLIRNLRLQRGLSQYDLASASNINNSYLSRIENGERRPSPKILKKFSEILQYPYDELIVASGILSEDFVRSVPKPAGQGMQSAPQQQMSGPASIPMADPTTEALRKLISTIQGGEPAAGHQVSPAVRFNRRGVPVFDTVPAGLLKEANVVQAYEEVPKLVLTEEELAEDPKAFALVVKGDSMIEAGIIDGDIVIVSPSTKVNDGDIAVVQVDHSTTTVKLVYFEDKHIILQAANSAYKPIILGYPNEVEILGKVILVRRKLG